MGLRLVLLRCKDKVLWHNGKFVQNKEMGWAQISDEEGGGGIGKGVKGWLARLRRIWRGAFGFIC